MAMFDPPSNLPVGKEPEDMFAGTAPVPAAPPRPVPPAVGIRPPVVVPRTPVPPPRTPEATASIAETPGRGLGKKVVRLIIFVVIAAALVTAGFVAYNVFFRSNGATNTNT